MLRRVLGTVVDMSSRYVGLTMRSALYTLPLPVDSPRRNGNPSPHPELLYTGKFATDANYAACLPIYLPERLMANLYAMRVRLGKNAALSFECSCQPRWWPEYRNPSLTYEVMYDEAGGSSCGVPSGRRRGDYLLRDWSIVQVSLVERDMRFCEPRSYGPVMFGACEIGVIQVNDAEDLDRDGAKGRYGIEKLLY
jgi:hypothetical protein